VKSAYLGLSYCASKNFVGVSSTYFLSGGFLKEMYNNNYLLLIPGIFIFLTPMKVLGNESLSDHEI
jgi:hypothetical protein